MNERYEELGEIARGACGIVIKSCQLFGSGNIVAIKEMQFPNRDEGVPCTVLREIAVLRTLNHPNVLRLLEVMSNEYGVSLVFEYLDMDLHDYITKHLVYLKPSPHVIKGILRHILLGVAYCHSHKIIHHDLKPMNILLDLRKGVMKIADFGLARPLDPPVNELSGEVVTMFYRAPEILLGFTNYSFPIDMWAVGCIFAEMVNLERLEPLFFPALTVNEVLFKIFRFVESQQKKSGLFSIPQQELGEVIRLEPAGLDLLSKMLCMNPADKISAADALDHEYFNSSEICDEYKLVSMGSKCVTQDR